MGKTQRYKWRKRINRARIPMSLAQWAMLALDLCLLPIALWCAFSLRLGEFYSIPQEQWGLFLGAPLIAIPVLIHSDLYRAMVRYMGHKTLWTIVRAVTTIIVLWSLWVLLMGRPGAFPRSVIGIFWFTSLMSIAGPRFLLRSFLWRGQTDRSKVIVYGAGTAGAQLVSALRYSPEMEPVAFVDDNPKLEGNELVGLRIHSARKLKRLIIKHHVQHVLLAIPSSSRARRFQIIARLETLPVSVQTLPGVSQIAQGTVQLSDLRDVKLEDLLGRDPVPADNELLCKNITDKSILVTGAGGSVGSELCRQIIRLKPKKLVLFEISEHALFQIRQRLNKMLAENNTTLVNVLGDVKDELVVSEVINNHKIQTIYHAAAYKHLPLVEENIIEGLRNNLSGTWSLAKAAEQHHVETFVLISTDKSVRPTSVMGASKRLAEMLIQSAPKSSNTKFISVRFGNVLGSSGSVVPIFTQQIKDGGPVTVTHPEMTRYFMTLEEATQLVIQAGALGQGDEIFVLDMGEPVKIDELARMMINLMGLTVKEGNSLLGDIEIQYTGIRPGEKLHEELFIERDAQLTQHPKIFQANDKSKSWDALSQQLDALCEKLNNRDIKGIQTQLTNIVEPQDNHTIKQSV